MGWISIYQSVYIPALTNSLELWVMAERTRSQIQAAETIFVCRVIRLTLRVWVRSSEIQKMHRVHLLLVCIERSQLWWFRQLIKMFPGKLFFMNNYKIKLACCFASLWEIKLACCFASSCNISDICHINLWIISTAFLSCSSHLF